MKKLGFLFCLITGLASAQELDSLAADSVEKMPPPYYLGVYVDAGLGLEPSVPRENFVGSYAVGVQYNRWFLEASAFHQLGSYNDFLIFPNVFSFKYRFGGLQAAYNILDKRPLTLRAGLGYYLGDMLWQYEESGQDFLRDTFRLYRVFFVVEYSKIRLLKPYISIGYQMAEDVQLPKVGSKDFSGLQAKVGVRLGFFNQ